MSSEILVELNGVGDTAENMNNENKTEKDITLPVNPSNVLTMSDFDEKKYQKREDNPLFDAEKLKNQHYINGLEYQVQQVRLRYPEKYTKYQAIGDSYMKCEYNLTSGIDNEGDTITSRHLLYTIRDYDIPDTELGSEELILLKRVYGEQWRAEIGKLE